ncbi:MAG: hypothetical protein GXY39_09045 [Actinomycetales bacterium]|nr:YbjN domain-containing protein [Tetrasphaera sp.]NLW99841.1 hypothetical protein [Actinomycetales bacterium]
MSDPTALPNFPPPSDEHPLRGLVIDALQDLGLEANIDKDGDVSFKANEQTMFVRSLENSGVRIMRVFGQWQIGEQVPQDKVMQLSVCNDLNLSMTMVKTGLGKDNLVVTSEHLVTSDDAVKDLLGTSIQIILATVQQWHERVTKLAERIAQQRAAAQEQGAAGGAGTPGARTPEASTDPAASTDSDSPGDGGGSDDSGTREGETP